MRTLTAALVLTALATACGPVVASITPLDGSGVPGDTDLDTDVDTDTDSDTDPDTEPEPDPVYGEWRGTRFIDFGRCEGELEEVGFLTDIPEARDACPECGDLVYQVDVRPGRICGVTVRSPAFRGIILGRRAAVMNIVPTDAGWEIEELAQGVFETSDDRIQINYSYEGQVGPTPFFVEGQANLLRTE